MYIVLPVGEAGLPFGLDLADEHLDDLAARVMPGILRRAWGYSVLGSLPCPGADAAFHCEFGEAGLSSVAHQTGCGQGLW